MELPSIVFGLILLLFGRRLFWVFVAVAGFLAGMEVMGLFLADQLQWVRILLAIAAGLLGALLAVLAQRLAFALAGFYGGAYFSLIAAQSMGAGGSGLFWFVLGGLIGGVIAALIMDWAIIVLSSLVGAGAIVRTLDPAPTVSIVIFALLVAVGCLVQAKLLRKPTEEGRRRR